MIDNIELTSGNCVVAVSGGVDSVVLLDILVKKSDANIIVAHFDHGIRGDSSKDADFVRNLAKFYDLVFETKREELGEKASELLARNRRYAFLREIAKKHDARLVTAHHNDDIIETVAINLTRGTGWRGLAVLDSDVARPLVGVSKSMILDYAKKNSLKWREDSTNYSDKYLRNRIRLKTKDVGVEVKSNLTDLWLSQKKIKQSINLEVNLLMSGKNAKSRYFFTNINETVAIECLRFLTDGRLTHPQMKKSLYMIKTALPGKTHHAGNGIEIIFSSRNFVIKVVK